MIGAPRARGGAQHRLHLPGRLVDNDTPVEGPCDVKFDLYDASSGGSLLRTQTKSSVTISSGTFTVIDLDFGASPFDGTDLWMEIRVRCPASIGAFGAAFTPRQRLTAVPYALFAVTSMGDAGSIDFSSGNINLANSTSANDGNILKNSVRFIHNYGTANTFLGASSGNFSMTGVGNTAVGSSALTANTTGASNTAIGESALVANSSGDANVAIGQAALADCTSGFQNVAVGAGTLPNVTDGLLNVAVGYNAGTGLTTGDKNIYLGYNVSAGSSTSSRSAAWPAGGVTKTYVAGIKGDDRRHRHCRCRGFVDIQSARNDPSTARVSAASSMGGHRPSGSCARYLPTNPPTNRSSG
jgi:hypothetical protein